MTFPRFVRVMLVALSALLPATRLAGQQSDPVDDLIRRVVNDVYDLRFANAIRAGRELLSASAALRTEQELTLRLALAAAYYPDVEGEQSPDSALAQFARVLRIAPDAGLPEVLAWTGLDSLFATARLRTLAAVLRPSVDSLTLVGEVPSTGIVAVASRPVHFRLSTRRIGGESTEVTHAMGARPSALAELSLRAVDGDRVLLDRGEFELVLTVTDPATGDSSVVTRRISAEGAAPTLLPLPHLDSSSLRPESRTPRPWPIAAAGSVMALATFAIADGMRATGPIGSAESTDARSDLIAFAILGATSWAIWVDRAGDDPEAATANAAVRALHERSLAAVHEENARRLGSHQVTVRFLGEWP